MHIVAHEDIPMLNAEYDVKVVVDISYFVQRGREKEIMFTNHLN